MFCNAFHSFSRLSEHVPLPKRSSGDATPPHHLVLELASPPYTLRSTRRHSLSPYRAGLAKSVTKAMQDDTQDRRV